MINTPWIHSENKQEKQTDVELLSFWILSIPLFLFKTRRFGDWILLRLQVEPTLLDPIDRASPQHSDCINVRSLHTLRN
jgi:hypothetical protein